MKRAKKIYNLNFSFHFGLNVCCLTDVALMILAGIGPIESRCGFLRLKLNRKLPCLRSLLSGDSKLSMHGSGSIARGVDGGCGERGG